MFILLLLVPTRSYGQKDSLRYRPDAIRFVDGALYTFSSPARWNGRELMMLGGILAGTTALTFIDQPVRNFWQGHDNRFMDGVERVGYHYGKPYSAFGVTAGFYLTGIIFKNEWAKETGLILGTTLIASGFMMGILKDVVGRARPGPGIGNMEFQPFNSSSAYHAFPSGHSTMAFGISVVLAKRVDSVPLKILFYSLAGTTAVGRMYSDSHWSSDVAFGSMLAWFCADTAISRMKVNRFRTVPTRDKFVWRVYPYPGGLTLTASM